jgi:hypothetical protein
MRKIEFEVPQDVIVDFVEELSERNLTNTITGVKGEDKIVIEVEYEKEESELVDELEEIFDNLTEEEDDED